MLRLRRMEDIRGAARFRRFHVQRRDGGDGRRSGGSRGLDGGR